MIIDTLDNATAYETLGPRFAKAFEYLRSGRAATDTLGKHELDGDRVFALVQEYTTKPAAEGLWEAHEKYADVQYVVTGREQMGYASLNSMVLDKDYNDADDYALYRGNGTLLPVPAGTFTVFLPQDVHMPCIAENGEPQPVRKVVVKVRV